MLTAAGSLVCTIAGCPSGLKGQLMLVPERTVLLLVVGANIISPPCRLHEQHEVVIGTGNILQPCLSLVRVPEMLLHHCLHLVDG